ncbi:MAG: hypothetical protein AUI14_07735 [Actinobacteria bacterium 13_2_20CM_2_71_6]|nr:MAG: hypothetical protein AUI14_07735 [Actinobacteria bacterium 13_2_20CM_2_71_6]
MAGVPAEQRRRPRGREVAGDVGVPALSQFGAGLAFGAVAGGPAFLIGVGAATAWVMLDKRFGLSNKIGDAAAAAAEGVADGVGAVAGAASHAASGAAHAASDAAGTVADGAGTVADGASGAVHGAKKLLHGLGI